jgi:hypothetical protein
MTDERNLLSLLKAHGPLSKAAILKSNRWTSSHFEQVKRKLLVKGLVIAGRGMRMKLAPRPSGTRAKETATTEEHPPTGSAKRSLGKTVPRSHIPQLSADEQKLFDMLDPVRVLNKAEARRRLKWAMPRFELVCAALVGRGLVVPGRGPGGSLRRSYAKDESDAGGPQRSGTPPIK